jgi:hypothetical protein
VVFLLNNLKAADRGVYAAASLTEGYTPPLLTGIYAAVTAAAAILTE